VREPPGSRRRLDSLEKLDSLENEERRLGVDRLAAASPSVAQWLPTNHLTVRETRFRTERSGPSRMRSSVKPKRNIPIPTMAVNLRPGPTPVKASRPEEADGVPVLPSLVSAAWVVVVAAPTLGAAVAAADVVAVVGVTSGVVGVQTGVPVNVVEAAGAGAVVVVVVVAFLLVAESSDATTGASEVAVEADPMDT
jgi:hypothetical protein